MPSSKGPTDNRRAAAKASPMTPGALAAADDWVICQNCEGDGGWPTSAAPQPLDHGYSPRPGWAGTCPRCGAKAGDNCAVLSDPVASPAPLDREEHMRTALILGRCAEMLSEALAGRARFEVREEARDSLAQARRRLTQLDALLFVKEGPVGQPVAESPDAD